MRMITTLAFGLALSAGIAGAAEPQSGSPHSTGQTVLPPENQGVKQPQGPTGPIETGTGGPPASSPQGQSPPSMQAAPEGSDKIIVDKQKK